MEKLDLQIFRELKQEIVDMITRLQEADERGEDIPEEEVQKQLDRYKEIIDTLSQYDLSDIDFEEWRGMYLLVQDDIPIDFSKTKANLDFSIIGYESWKATPNLKSCQIKNFDFERYEYSPDMFDEEFRKENEGRFLSPDIPEDVAERFFEGKITLTDIKNNPELANKVGERNIDWSLRDIYKLIGREEFCKLDAEFMDKTSHSWREFLESNPNLRTAEEIMPVLYKTAREKILGYGNDTDRMNRFYHSQDELGETFRQLNPDLFLSDDVPEHIRDSYYHHSLSLRAFSENLDFFEGKKIAHALSEWGDEKKLVSLYGDNIYQLFVYYKPIMDKIINDWSTMRDFEVPSGPITEEQRAEIMRTTVSSYFRDIDRIEDLSMLKMVMDFVPLEDLQFYNDRATTILGKYDIDDLINAGLDFQIFHSSEGHITNLDQIKKLSDTIEPEDLPLLLSYADAQRIEKYGIDTLIGYGIKDLSEVSQPITDLQQIKEMLEERPLELINLGGYSETYTQLIEKYGVDALIEYGIKNVSELTETTTDLHRIKEMLEKRPAELINMGRDSDKKIEFIQKYGIDNIIALDEETGGMFSHSLWGNDIYLLTMATAEGITPKLETDKQLTYEQFRDRMYEILLHARDERGLLTSRDYQDYDFIQGKFREDHPEIFIDGEISDEIKRDFYTRHMTAELVRQNPELIQLLQGKDLSRAFPKDMIAGISLSMKDKDGNMIGGIPNNVNMAQYLSEKIGQEEFLKICAEYGKCLDTIGLSTKGQITPENIRETIEQAIYKGIKEKGMEYFEFLPSSFQEKHPELFLPKDIDEELRSKFYKGTITFEDVRKNPQIKDLLLTKDISVGFGRIKYGQPMLGRGGQRYVNPMWEILSEQEIMDFAERYGKFFSNIDQSIFKDGQSQEERENAIQNNIEENILNRKSAYDESIPEFFKQRHPEMFLDENAPEELKKAFYDNRASNRGYLNISGDVIDINFAMIKEHPEWREFLQGKDLSRAFSREYSELFKRFDSSTLMKLGTRNPETIEKMVQSRKEELLENWYKSTGGKFVPHHVVMLNFPEGEIDSFLGNSKRWSQLMRIENYNLNDDGKAAILKAAYAMGVFQGDDDGFNKTMKLFTDIPQELTQEEYEKVEKMFERFGPDGNVWGDISYDEDAVKSFRSAYTPRADGKYVFSMDKQKNKDVVKLIRGILEHSNIDRILTPIKAHQMFDSFAMEYNPDFARFFNENVEEILSNPEFTKDIATIQRQFSDIVRTNAGRRLTLDVAQDYIKSIAYTDIEIGNEGVAEQAKIAGYSQKDFEAIQSLFNEGEVRDFSSIPRIQGSTKGYTYEMLRCDDPLALTIGTLTDCCQEIHGAGQTSMEHSVVSPDGRVFCVRDAEGRLVAQSWFWRNQYTGCFDNIEIPHRIFELYEKQHPDVGRKGLTADVLEVYKKAAQDLMQEDARVYQELLENGTITQEQYDALLLGKVTIGLGYNDIADAIQADKTIHKETDKVGVKGTERLPHPYTDASTQYTIAEREGTVKSEHENLYVHQDDVPVYDGTNMSSTVLLTMKRMEQATDRENLAYLSERSDESSLPRSQRIINSIAREYGLDPNDTRVMATARIALIYSKDKDNKVRIGELLSSPLKEGLTEEQTQKATAHIMHQVKKALKQIGVQDSEVDLSSLSEEQQQMLQSVMQEIEKENDERGER